MKMNERGYWQRTLRVKNGKPVFRRGIDLRDIAMRQYDGWEAAGRRGLERDGLTRVIEVRLRLMVLVAKHRRRERDRYVETDLKLARFGLWWPVPVPFRPDPRKWWNQPEAEA